MDSPRPSTIAVFLREARRASRRWQTYLLRMSVAAGGFVGLFILSTLTDLGDPARSAEFGRNLFLFYSTAQMVIVALLAPLLVGLGVAEEREEGTLQLLLMTRLSTLQILWGKIISRLIVLASFILGGLPVLALVASFGGVGPWEVVHATGNALLVALVLGTIGGVAALFSGGGAIALAAAMLWAGLSWGLLPLAAAALLQPGPGSPVPYMALFSPFAAMVQTDWRGLMPLLTNLPVVVLLAGLTTPLFRLVTTRSTPTLDGPLLGDGELAHAARVQRRVGVMALLVPVFVVASLVYFWINRPFGSVSAKVTPPWWMTTLSRLVSSPEAQQVGQGLVIATVVLTMMLSAGAIALVQLRAAGLIAQAFGGAHGQMGSFASALRSFDAVVRPRRLPVWPLPTAWREVATRGLGAPAVFTRWLTLPMLAFATFVVCLGASANEHTLSLLFGGCLGLLSMVLTIVVAVSSIATERQQRTLPLMLTTTHRVPWLFLGKTIGVMLTTGPWVLTSLLLLALGMSLSSAPFSLDPYLGDVTCEYPFIAPYSPLIDALEVTVWGASLWWALVMGSMVVAMRARPARTAFPIVIGAVITFVVVIAVLDDAWFRHLVGVVFPILRSYYKCSGDWRTVGVITAQMGLGALFLLTLLLRGRAWILADARAS